MIKITIKQLEKLNACEAGIDWFKAQKKRSLKTVIASLLKDKHFDYAKWLLNRLLTKEQNQLWAISSAESVLHIFESKFPNDLRPRKAIQAAKDFLEGKISREAVYAAAYAADAAAYAAYANAAYAAYANAAYAAAYAAADAADAYANAAYAAADAAAYAADARRQKEIEVCNFALRLLGEIE